MILVVFLCNHTLYHRNFHERFAWVRRVSFWDSGDRYQADSNWNGWRRSSFIEKVYLMTAQLPNDLLNCIWKLQFPLMNKRVAKLAKKYFSFWYTVSFDFFVIFWILEREICTKYTRHCLFFGVLRANMYWEFWNSWYQFHYKFIEFFRVKLEIDSLKFGPKKFWVFRFVEFSQKW